MRSILHLQRAIGNQAVQRMLHGSEHDVSRIPGQPPVAGAIQAKLAINEPGDSYERDADRMAEQVMRAPEPQIQRREHESLRTGRVQASDTGQREAPPIVHEALRSPGRPLDPATRAFMEPRFGHDFSRVRVHTGATAEESSRAVNAHAYAVGHDVVFAAGRFAPETQAGRRLIAHELAHTVQQSDGAPAAVARAPKGPPFAINQRDMVHLQNTMLQFYGLLTPGQRASLQRNATVVIALVTYDNKPGLAYSAAGNRINPGIRAAAEQLGLIRLDPEGVPRIAGEHHAEQLAIEGATMYGFEVQGMVVSRTPCEDCGPVVAEAGIPIAWVPDPIPAPRTAGAPSGPPAGGAAEAGAPLEPVSEATPGFNPGAGAAVGGAVQLIQSMLFAGLQKDEVAKYERRRAELQPRIDAYLAGGYSVELILIVEKPNRPDVLCAGGVFCDQGQFIYFHDLYISRVESVKPATPPSRRASTSQTSMSPAGGGEGFVPWRHEGGPVGEGNEKDIPSLPTRDPEHHCEYERLNLSPEASMSPIEATRPPARPVKARPRLDAATRKALALAPSRVYILSGNINQYETAYEIRNRLTGNPSFVVVKEEMTGGLDRSRTIVSYWSDLDRPRAEALAEIVRSEGVPSVGAEPSGAGDHDPGVLQISVGRDAEK